ncbi:MAG: hypothetical protein EXR86_05495 [Gammaproteobacteria bacterium]|nr:hypothetical protein [Gammaproteobacteria bacterium]
MLVQALVVGLLTFCTVADARDVFRTDDQSGTEYSDTESPGATRITIEESVNEPIPQWSSAQPGADQNLPEVPILYESLEITSPSNRETVRSNSGDIPVTIKSKPSLQTAHGHELRIVVDGTVQVTSGINATYQASTLDRGTHTLAVAIFDRVGVELIRSAPVVVYLHRHSLKFRKKPSPPPKK